MSTMSDDSPGIRLNPPPGKPEERGGRESVQRFFAGFPTSAPLETVPKVERIGSASVLAQHLTEFRQFGQSTRISEVEMDSGGSDSLRLPVYMNEFWTARQRAAHSLHEISYRACFKPQLPRFFIERLTRPGDIVYDPFMGRGTTLLEAALLGRVPKGCDINPLSVQLCRPRMCPIGLDQIEQRLKIIDFSDPADSPEDLLVFYHPDTLRQISSLKHYFLQRRERGEWDAVDDWICMVALNRLTGHSPGFFSVYTLPPNQAVSVRSQQRINQRREQIPPSRDVISILLKKTRSLLKDCQPSDRETLGGVGERSLFLTGNACATPALASDSVDLVVTSPPFLNVVDYATDNWLRCWFLGVDAAGIAMTVPSKLADWRQAMTGVLVELHRVLKPGRWIAFEVGEVRKGTVRLEEAVLSCGRAAGLKPELILINAQKFTKTANCWGVANNAKGTNSNRIALFRKA